VGFKVILSQKAVNDLEGIVDYISRDDPGAALRVGNDLVNRAESLAEMPWRGRALHKRPGVRRIVRNPYLIIYRIDEAEKAVMVLRFWHGSRDPRSLWLE
jgi:toxin ParE1/3/4